jgi:dolichol-phosphate mannosyltransferase
MIMKTYIMIPTYKEKENIALLIEKLRELAIPDLTIVIVDDNSPDGTIEIVRDLIRVTPGLELIVRKENRGRAFAEIEGLKYCVRQGADYVLEMDADFSHDPRHIPEILEKMRDHDMVIGSRFVKGGRLVRSGFTRNLITNCARAYMNVVLGLNIKDPTSGYRCFRAGALKSINLECTLSEGFAVVQEVLYKMHRRGYSIVEVPVVFEDRVRGKSKFPLRSVTQGLIMMLVFRLLFSKVREPEDAEIVWTASGGE